MVPSKFQLHLQYLERKALLGSMCVLYPGRIAIWRSFFFWREENRRTRRKTLELGENQQQIQPIYGTGPASNPGCINWWKVNASLLRFPCSPSFIRCSNYTKSYRRSVHTRTRRCGNSTTKVIIASGSN